MAKALLTIRSERCGSTDACLLEQRSRGLSRRAREPTAPSLAEPRAGSGAALGGHLASVHLVAHQVEKVDREEAGGRNSAPRSATPSFRSAIAREAQHEMPVKRIRREERAACHRMGHVMVVESSREVVDVRRDQYEHSYVAPLDPSVRVEVPEIRQRAPPPPERVPHPRDVPLRRLQTHTEGGVRGVHHSPRARRYFCAR